MRRLLLAFAVLLGLGGNAHAFLMPISAGAGGVTITGVSLSTNSFLTSCADSTVIATISTTTTGGSFTGSYSLSGTDAASFKVSGSSLECNGTVAAGTYSINVIATMAGASSSPFTQPETLTGSSATSLGISITFLNNGPSTLTNPDLSFGQPLQLGDLPNGYSLQLRAHGSSTIISNVQMDQGARQNTDGSYSFVVPSFISPDTITAGSTILYDLYASSVAPNNTPWETLTQLAGNSNWILQVTGAGGDLGTDNWDVTVNNIINVGATAFSWGVETGTPGGSGCLTSSSISGTMLTVGASSCGYIAAGNAVVGAATGTIITSQLSGTPGGAGTYSVNISQTLASVTKTVPIEGCQQIRSGPSDIEIECWGVLQRTTDGAFHKFLVGKLDIRAWSDGNFEVNGSVAQENMYGPNDAGTVGTTPEGAHYFTAEILNGASVIGYFGGVNDTRKFTVSSTAFNVAGGYVTLPNAGGTTGCSEANTTYGSGGAPWQLSGSLPSGLSSSTPYWLACNQYVAPGGSTAFLAPNQTQSVGWNDGGNFGGTWSATTGYNTYATGSTGVVANNILYKQDGAQPCTSGGSNPFTSTAANGITDGTCVWDFIGTLFTTQGSGTITFSPLIATFPRTEAMLVPPGGERIGNSVATVLQGQDFTYLATKSKAVLPWQSGITINNVTAPCCASGGFQEILAFSQNSLPWPGNIDNFGDNVGRENVGVMNHSAVRCLYSMAASAVDTKDCWNAKVLAHTFQGFTMAALMDERCHCMGILNDGHAKNGVTYAGFAPVNPDYGIFAGAGSPVPGTVSTTLADTNQFSSGQETGIATSSHLPNPGYGPYLQTGDITYLREIQSLSNNFTLAQRGALSTEPTSATIGGVTYWGLINTPDAAQPRANAWSTDHVSNALWVTPINDPVQPYLADLMADTSAYLVAWGGNQNANYAALGNLDDGVHNTMDNGCPNNTAGCSAPWEFYMAYLTGALEAWRGNSTMLSFLTGYGVNFVYGTNDSADSTTAGCEFGANAYTNTVEATAGSRSTAYTKFLGAGQSFATQTTVTNTGSISGLVMTDTGGLNPQPGSTVTGTGVTGGTVLGQPNAPPIGNGVYNYLPSGPSGTWAISPSQSVSSTTLTFTFGTSCPIASAGMSTLDATADFGPNSYASYALGALWMFKHVGVPPLVTSAASLISEMQTRMAVSGTLLKTDYPEGPGWLQ